MRRVNVRLVTVLAVIAVVGGGGLFGLYKFQHSRHAKYFLKQADAREQEWKEQRDQGEDPDNDLITQAINFRARYLGLYPNDIEELSKQGSLYFDHGFASDAFFTFEKVLRLDPDRTAIRRKVVLAALHPHMGRTSDARAHLKYLLDRDPDDPELLYYFGQCQQQDQKYEEAVDSLEKAIDNGSKEDKRYHECFRDIGTICVRHLHDTKRGDEFMERLIKDNPSDPIGYTIRARYHLFVADRDLELNEEARKARYAQALADAKQAVEKCPQLNGDDVKKAIALTADQEAAFKKAIFEPAETPEKAKEAVDVCFNTIFKEGIDMSEWPDEDRTSLLESLHVAADAANMAKDDEAAAEFGRLLVKFFENRPNGYLALANSAERLDNRDQAIEWIRRGMVDTKESLSLLWALGQYYTEAGQFEQARETLERIRVRNMDQLDPRQRSATDAALKHAEALLEATKGNWRNALQMFEDNRENIRDNPVLTRQAVGWIAKCKSELGDSLGAAEEIERLQDTKEGRAAYANQLAQAGRIDEAIKEWQKLVLEGKEPDGAVLEIARLLVLRNQKLAKSKQDWNQVLRILDQAEERDPKRFQIATLRAEVYRQMGDIDRARTILREAIAESPDEFGLRNRQVMIEIGELNWDEAERLLKKIGDDLGDSPSVRLLKARYLLAKQGESAAEPIRALMEGTDGFTDEDKAVLAKGIATAAEQAGDLEFARSLAEQLAGDDPRNLAAQLRLFELASRKKDEAGMQKQLQTLREIEGEGAYWHYGSALLLTTRYHAATKKDPKLLADALQHLLEASVLRPMWKQPAVLTATIYDAQGNRERAIEYFNRAVMEMGDHQPAIIRRLVVLLFQDQRFEEADRVIGLLERDQITASEDLTRIWAEIKLLLGDYETALELAKICAKDSDDYRDHVWLGRIYAALAERAAREKNSVEAEQLGAEAEKALRKALEINAADPEPWVAMVQLLSVTGNSEKARALVEEAKKKIDADKLPTALSRMYDISGDFAAARGQLMEELKADPNDPVTLKRAADFFIRKNRVNEAAELLKRMIAGKETSEKDVVWARRRLALILFESGGYQNYLKAIELMDENLKLDPGSLFDQRIKARVLATRATRKQRKEAIAMIENLLKGDQTGTSEDRFVLARLYLAEGNWSEASKQMRQLISAAGDNPKYLEVFIRDMITRGEGREADIWVDQLEKLAPKAFPTADVRAQVLAEQGKINDAISVLETFLAAEDAMPLDKNDRLLLVARTLETIADRLELRNEDAAAAEFIRTAEGVYRRYVDVRPKDELLLGAFLARQGRVDSGLEILENVWKDMPDTPLGAATVSMFDKTGATDAQLSRIEKVLNEALADRSSPTPLLLAKAELCIFQSRDADAEKIYRDVIEKNPRNVVALNNLAVFLANRRTDLDNALVLVNKCIELAGPVAPLLDSRASVYMAQENWEAAIEDLEEAIADKATPTRYFHLAEAYHGFQDTNNAMEALKEAHSLGLNVRDLRKAERPRYDALKRDLSRAPESR